jgi:hypothetical protein
MCYVDFLGGRSRFDAIILTRIKLKGATNFELNFFQIDSVLALLKF